MPFLVILFGLFGGCLLSVLVGLIGSGRHIGFGWSFLISLIFTPLIGLIVTLLSDPLPDSNRRWGCLGVSLGMLGVGCLLIFLLLCLGVIAAAV